jgi:hypothetical protein
MRVKASSIALVIALAGATAFAVFHDDLASASGSKAAAPVQRALPLESLDDDESDEVPAADDPEIGSGIQAAQGTGEAVAPSDLRPALTWKVPVAWPSAPNPSSMRLATHRVPRASGDAEDAELSIARAGGDVEANVERWVGQFGGSAAQTRHEKAVRGLKITVVELEGTYEGGMGTAEGQPHSGWALLGAIVVGPEQPYFFKLTGPEATVRAARPAFEALLDAIVPVPGAP